ncbi:LuxR C-terminal-related transcriptional regulator [Microvirga massiliensis]|uniref:LuxR C-terminal-related transcriptional regulator n=1 Tax=Microvirga massiliensis TaxID=1033741 RepID=UPI00093EA1C5|nr:response regulator transcription factor [Microvirga massiliensis]
MSMQSLRRHASASSDRDLCIRSRRAREAACPAVATYSVFILSDVCFVREGLLAAFRSDPDFSSVKGSATAEEALAADCSGVVLLDAVFPGAQALAKKIARAVHSRQLIVLAIEEETETIIEWAKLGAAGYVPRHATLAQVLNTVKGVIRGEQICAPAIAGGLIRHISGLPSMAGHYGDCGDAQLTVREVEILPLLGAGSSNKDIARRLNIEVATAKCHVHNILSKLRLQRRGQVAHWMQAKRGEPVNLPANR